MAKSSASEKTASTFITAASTTEDALRIIGNVANTMVVGAKAGTKGENGTIDITTTLSGLTNDLFTSVGVTAEQWQHVHTGIYTTITAAVAEAAALLAIEQIDGEKGIPAGGIDVSLGGETAGVRVNGSASLSDTRGYVAGSTVAPVDVHATAHNNNLRQRVLEATAKHMKK